MIHPAFYATLICSLLFPTFSEGQNGSSSVGEQLERIEQLTDSLAYEPALQLSDEVQGVLENTAHHPTSFVRLHSLRARIFNEKGNYPEAEQAAQICLDKCQISISKPNRYCANAHYYQGLTYQFTSRSQQAFSEYKAALAEYQQLGTPAYSALATTHRRLSVLERHKRNFAQAHSHLTDALDICARISPPDSIGMADTYISLALTLEAQGERMDSTYLLYQKAQQIYLQQYKRDHPQVAKASKYMGINLLRRSLFGAAIEVFEQVKSIYTNVYSENHPEVGRAQYFLSIAVEKSGGRLDEAIHHGAEALAITLLSVGQKSIEARNCYNRLGNLYRGKGDYAASRQNFEKALSVQYAIYEEENEATGLLYDNLGQTIEVQGDHELAALYFNRALQLKIKVLGENNDRVAESLYSLGNNQRKRGLYPQAIAYLNQAASIYRTNHQDSAFYELGNLYTDLGILYKMQGDYDNALKYYQKAREHYTNTVGEAHRNIAVLLQRIATVYSLQLDYDNALHYFQEALHLAIQTVGRKHAETANVYRGLADVYLKLGVLEQSRTHLDTAAHILGYQPSKPSDFEQVIKPAYLYEVFRSRTHYFQASITPTNKTYYLDSLQVQFTEWLGLIEYVIEQPQSALMRLNYQQDILPVVEGAIANQIELGSTSHYARIFVLLEKAKARQLTTSLQAQALSANYTYRLPDSLLKQEAQLAVDLSYVRQQRFKSLAAADSLTDDRIGAYDQQILELIQSQVELQEYLQDYYPKYYQWRYTPRTLSMKLVKEQLLEEDHTLLSYFWGEDAIYLLLVQKEHHHLVKIDSIQEVERLSKRLIELMQQQGNYFTNQAGDIPMNDLVHEYTTIANTLYEHLLAPVEALLTPSLIIIPDNHLGSFPFEYLLTSSTITDLRNFSDYPYLLKKYAISYAYSASTLYEKPLPSEEAAYQKSLLVMAPFSDRAYQYEINSDGYNAPPKIAEGNRNGLTFSVLPGTKTIAKQLVDIWEGDSLLDSLATEEFLRKGGKDYQIIHLATHGIINYFKNDFSFLAFAEVPDSVENEILYLHEIYNLKLKADLVVLSACEAGTGKYLPGEGMFSLAHAFFYTGAKSLLTSFWPAEDTTTGHLMLYFYELLRTGIRKDQALQMAKLKFMEKHPGFQSHPFFWGGVIAIGNMSAVTRN